MDKRRANSLFMLKLTAFIVLLSMWLSIGIPSAQAYTSDLGNGQFQNPIMYADDPDPSVIKVGDTYYMSNTSMHLMPGIPIMQSKDLVNWEMVSYAYDRIDVGMSGIDQAHADAYNLTGNKNVYGKGSWATSLKYHNGKFYVVFASLDLGKTFVLTHSAPIGWGGWDFTQIQGLGYAHDPELFFDTDDKVYLFYGGCTVTELNSDAKSVKAGGVNKKIFDGGSSHDGNRVFKRNGYYYVLSTPVKDGASYRIEKAWRSQSLTGVYEQKVILDDNPNHQAAVVEDGLYQWAMVFADAGGVGRIPKLAPVNWTDNWPIIGNNGKVPAASAKPAAGNGIHIMDTSDEFTTPSYLPAQWQWNHNPDNAKWSMSERPGWMRLKTSYASNLYDARNTLTQRSQGPTSSGWVKLDTSNIKNGQIAGLSAFFSKYGYIAVKNTNGNKQLVAYNMGNTGETAVNLLQSVVYLKIDFDCVANTAKFYYSYNEQTWLQLGDTLKMEYFYTNPVNGNSLWYVGYRFGLFNYTTGSDLSGYADFDYFHFSSTATGGIDKQIALKAAANNKFVSADNGGASALIANRTSVGQWETFDRYDNGDGTISLRAHANNKFVCADQSGTSPLIANRDTVSGSWERFQIVTNSDGTISLKSMANNQFVTAEQAGAESLIANRTTAGSWEKFTIVNQ